MKKKIWAVVGLLGFAAPTLADVDLSSRPWCRGLPAIVEPFTFQQAKEFIQAGPIIDPWTEDLGWNQKTWCSLVYKANWGRIWSLGFFYSLNCIFLRDEVIPSFGPSDYVLIPFWGEIYPGRGFYSSLIRHAKHPGNIFFLANSESDARALREEGVQAFAVSHNAFIDSQIFIPQNAPKKYAAVYSGSTRPQKRLDLARQLASRLCVVSHDPADNLAFSGELRKFIFNPKLMEIPEFLCQATCGLILSAQEGGCYASTEYLYCGIPVVSTVSIGGRDAYFDEYTALVTPADPEAIAAAVDRLDAERRDPWEIRRRALAVTDSMLHNLCENVLGPIFRAHHDPHSKDPRCFVNHIIKNGLNTTTKGRTVFQPEIPTHPTLQSILDEMTSTPQQ